MNLRAENLVKRYGWVSALAGVSLEFAPGQIVAVLGPNGAGKTTLLNALAGLIQVDEGRVIMDREAYTPARGDLRRCLAVLPDIPPVPANWTALRLIGTMLKLYETPSAGLDERVVALLERLDLLGVARWHFRQLSRGQSYKAVLAAFLAADPEVWLVDEPFASGMDPRGLNCFKQYAREAVTRGRTIVYTTQIIEVAEQFADRICVLDRGQLKAFDVPAKLHEQSGLEALVTQLQDRPGP